MNDSAGAPGRFSSYWKSDLYPFALRGALSEKGSSCECFCFHSSVLSLCLLGTLTLRPLSPRRAPVPPAFIRVGSTVFPLRMMPIRRCSALGNAQVDTTRAANIVLPPGATVRLRFLRTEPARADITPRDRTALNRSDSSLRNRSDRYRRSGYPGLPCTGSSKDHR